jgi:CysZ protein
MFESLRAFSEGWKFHISGIRFAFQHLSFLGLSLIPFLVTLALYASAFYLFTLYADDLLRMLWHGDTVESSKYVGWLYWAYIHVVKFFLYLIVLVIMFYTFIVLSNIVGSPFYDHISARYERMYCSSTDAAKGTSPSKGALTAVKEESKKAALMLLVPLPLVFIPVLGQVLGFLVAAAFIAWDYMDFSLSRHCPLLKGRMKTIWRHKFLLVGFGCPLLIPLLGLLIMPFAIFGSTKLYFERIKEA